MWFGLFPVRSPLLGESLPCFLFLEVLRWFTSLRSPSHTYEFSVESPGSLPVGLPHSDICGSVPARDSPQLFAACHVLLRLWLPRHPPYALSSLTINLFEDSKFQDQRSKNRTFENSLAKIPFTRSSFQFLEPSTLILELLHQCYFPVVPLLFNFQRTLQTAIACVLRSSSTNIPGTIVVPGNFC
jgi:hypothetical protein